MDAFEDGRSWGIAAAIDLHDCDPRLVRSATAIEQFVVSLCQEIGVKRFGDCTVVHFGEDEKVAGYSMVQLIETSLISGHFVNQTNNIFLDVFSCKNFDAQKVSQRALDYFKAKDYSLKVTIRQ